MMRKYKELLLILLFYAIIVVVIVFYYLNKRCDYIHREKIIFKTEKEYYKNDEFDNRNFNLFTEIK